MSGVEGMVVSATTSTAVLLPRVGPRPLMTVGLLVASLGMASPRPSVGPQRFSRSAR
ncbi:hypothetical protein [Rhodococcus sp. NPDC058514]|uniref:hypothetical protein n=1 Tax=Rhodococcus sp. NPDC058514 TaxID=3346532 RepID=UPI003668D05B